MDVSFFAIIVAAGDGERLGASERKAAVPLAGSPLVTWSLKTIAGHPGCRGGALVVHPKDVARAESEWIPGAAGQSGGWSALPGGTMRSQSVAAGMAAAPESASLVLVHDAARPLLTGEDLDRVVQEAAQHGAAILASPVSDTLKHVDEGAIDATVSRDGLWQAETPQVFRSDDLRRAHGAGNDATDDAALVSAIGVAVRVVQSLHPNPKVTLQKDLRIAEAILKASGRSS